MYAVICIAAVMSCSQPMTLPEANEIFASSTTKSVTEFQLVPTNAPAAYVRFTNPDGSEWFGVNAFAFQTEGKANIQYFALKKLGEH